jgi:streptogramin lyase
MLGGPWLEARVAAFLMGAVSCVATAQSFTLYELPIVSFDRTYGIAVGPDGNLWFTQPGANLIGRITT